MPIAGTQLTVHSIFDLFEPEHPDLPDLYCGAAKTALHCIHCRGDYLQKILTARVYDVAVETPLELAKSLSLRIGNQVWLKREDQQQVFSFKLRGAYNKMAHLTPEQLNRGVICASAGNHAQGVALSASRLGCKRT
jgi:threonine dehydratase